MSITTVFCRQCSAGLVFQLGLPFTRGGQVSRYSWHQIIQRVKLMPHQSAWLCYRYSKVVGHGLNAAEVMKKIHKILNYRMILKTGWVVSHHASHLFSPPSWSQLARNPRLDQFFVRDLNTEPSGWAMDDQSLDAVVCCVSVQYLQQPEQVMREIYRVLKPGGIAIFSFSNR